MKYLVMMSVCLFSIPAFAAPTCYQLSVDPITVKVSDRICVVQEADDIAMITLLTGEDASTPYATFRMTMTGQSKCMDCNQTTYGLLSESSSALKSLTVEFDGQVELETESEAGTVSVAGQKFYYRSL